jgi:hypothetical protein
VPPKNCGYITIKEAKSTDINKLFDGKYQKRLRKEDKYRLSNLKELKTAPTVLGERNQK